MHDIMQRYSEKRGQLSGGISQFSEIPEPPFCTDRFTHLTFRLYVLRIKPREKAKPTVYRIAYGVVTRHAGKAGRTSAGDFTDIGSYSFGKCALSTLTIAGDKGTVLNLFQAMCQGRSLRDALKDANVAFPSLPPDVDVTLSRHVRDLPWGVDQLKIEGFAWTWSMMLLEPLELLDLEDRQATDCIEMLMVLAKALADKTGLPFDHERKEYSGHIGSLEILLQPDRTPFGRSLVTWIPESGKPGPKTVRINAILAREYESFTVNFLFFEGGRNVGNTVQTKLCTRPAEDISFEAEASVPLSKMEILVWGSRRSDCVLIHRGICPFVSSVRLQINLLRGSFHVQTPWIEQMRRQVPKEQLARVQAASGVVQFARDWRFIGEEFPARPFPDNGNCHKDNDRFFPKGWDFDAKEHGLLSFLEWFRGKTKNAKRIFLQDPYFEDVALDFLCLSDSDCEFTVLTQTRLRTNDDGTSVIVDDGINRRKQKILKCLETRASVFGGHRLIIKDLAENKNRLHDRYLLIEFQDGHREGYALSNSLQGATRKCPLLVTQIGDGALRKVVAWIRSLIEREPIEEISRSGLSGTRRDEGDPIASARFLEILKSLETFPDAQKRAEIEKSLLGGEAQERAERIATLGWYLASMKYPEQNAWIRRQAESATPAMVEVLSNFLINSFRKPYPVGFAGAPGNEPQYVDFRDMLQNHSFGALVCARNVNMIRRGGYGFPTERVYGHLYAWEILLMAAPEAAIHVFERLLEECRNSETENLKALALRAANMMLTRLFLEIDLGKDRDLLSLMLLSQDEACKGLGALFLLNSCVEHFADPGEFHDCFTAEERRAVAYAACLGQSRDTQQTACSWLLEYYRHKNDSEIVISDAVRFLSTYVPQEVQEFYLSEVVAPLIESGVVQAEDVLAALVDKLLPRDLKGLSRDATMAIANAINCSGGELSALRDRVKQEIQRVENETQRMILYTDDKLYESAKGLLELRCLLRQIVLSTGHQALAREVQTLLESADAALAGIGQETQLSSIEYLAQRKSEAVGQTHPKAVP